MKVTLANLLADILDKTRNSTTGALDNSKRTRAINRVLEDLQDTGDWEFTKRTKTFFFIDGVSEYNLEDYVGTNAQDIDGSTSVNDFKNPYDLKPVDEAGRSLDFKDVKEVREKIRRNRISNVLDYGVDNNLLVINYPKQISAQLHNCDSLTANGVVSASGDAINLTIDTVEFQEGSGSVNFDVSAGNSLVITFTDFNAKDLETLQNKSHFLFRQFLPTITNFTSIKAEWGDDGSNNWSKTETVPAANQTLATGWSRWAFRWADATENGSPTPTSINFVRITITFSSAITDTDFRIDDIRIGKEVEFDLDYYSLAMVKDTDGDFQIGFNPDDVTQTDVLLGPESKLTVESGSFYELFTIIGGKSERDRTDSFKIYEKKKVDLLKRVGHRLRRPSKVLNFQRR